MKKIKILMVLNNPGRRGAQTFAINVLRSIDKTKYQVDFVFSADKQNGYKDEIISLGSKIFFIPQFKGSNWKRYTSEWHKLLSSVSYDIVHGHVSSSASIYLRIAKQYGCITIAHSHSTGYRGNAFERIIKRIFTLGAKRYADYWLACSNDAAKRLFGRNFSQYERFYLMPNSIIVRNFMFSNDARNRIRSKHKIADDTFVCGHVGSFSIPKNHKYLLKIFKEILCSKPNSVLMLVGDGYFKKEIESKAKELDIYNKVIFVGAVGNANEYLMAMDTMIFPSIFEGFGFSVLEAQATGLYTLMSDTIPNDVVLTDIVKRLSIRDNCTKWAKSVEVTPLEDREKYNDVIAKSKYSMDNSIKLLCDIYNDAVKDK